MIELKTPTEIKKMHITGQFVAQVLTELQGLADVGVNLLDLEHHVHRRIDERGAESCYWDYTPSFGSGPFRNVICLSVNDAVLHGLPHDYRLRDGDVLGMDLAVGIDGWVADSAITVIVGTATEDDGRLVRATRVALEAAIEAAQPGNRLGDVSAAIGAVADAHGYVVRQREEALTLLAPRPGERVLDVIWTTWAASGGYHSPGVRDQQGNGSCCAMQPLGCGTDAATNPWPCVGTDRSAAGTGE
jgi:methionine aminopeptidase